MVPMLFPIENLVFFQSFFSTKNCARLRNFSTLNSFRRRRATSRHAPRSPGAACCSLGEHRRLGPDAVPARCRRAAVPSMLRDYEQFPTTGGDIEEHSCGRPGPRAALSASQSASIGSLLRQARWCCIWFIKKGGRVILLAWPDFSNFTTAEVKRTMSS